MTTPKPALPEPVPPNAEGSTTCIVRWMVTTRDGLWLGAWDKEAFAAYTQAAIDAAVAEVNALNGALTDKCNSYIIANARLAEQVAEARAVPDGWNISRQENGSIDIRGPGHIAVNVRGAEQSPRLIPTQVLYELAEAMLSATPSPTTRSQQLAAAGFTRRPSLWAMQAREALELIAAPRRPDGTWNRDREACRQLAAEALGRDPDDQIPAPAEQPKPAVRDEKLYDAIKEVLLHHRLSYTEGEDAEAFPLVDMLCPPGSRDISKGRDEITLICDAIYNDEAVRAAISGEQP